MSSILGSIISSTGGGGGTVDDEQLALKADLSYVNTQLSDKADLSLLTGVSVKIGFLAGSVNQANLATAVGEESGKENQQAGACAYGNSAGEFNQSSRSVAIGEVAGQNNLGEHSLAIGAEAGRDSQAPRSIVLNATGTVLNNTVNDSCKIAPIRAQDVGSHILSYNDTTKEIVKSTIAQVQSAVGGGGGGALTTSTPYNATTLGNTFDLKANLDAPQFVGSSHPTIIRYHPTNTSQVYVLAFKRGIDGSSTTVAGGIFSSTTATSYATSSDYRLKDVISPITDASTRLLALKPIRFSWKSTGQEVDGFLAHETQEVVPEAVTGTKDAVDVEGNPEYQGIDQAKLVPLLVASLQDALKRIAVLEALVL